MIEAMTLVMKPWARALTRSLAWSSAFSQNFSAGRLSTALASNAASLRRNSEPVICCKDLTDESAQDRSKGNIGGYAVDLPASGFFVHRKLLPLLYTER